MGLDWGECLSFDVACVAYDERFDQELKATKEVPAPQTKRQPTIPVPLHEQEELMRMLGFSKEDIEQTMESEAEDPRVTALVDDILRGSAAWLKTPKKPGGGSHVL